MREILYQEAARGIFEPVPTPAQKRIQKRQAKLKADARAKKIETVLSMLGFTLVVIICAAIFGLNIFADQIWPVIRP